MQRLYSSFPCGLPGVGLLLLRSIVAIPLIHSGLLTTASQAPVVAEVAVAAGALLMFVGLWTPIAGALVAVTELYLAVSHPADPWSHVRVGVLSAAIALLGPGGCSVDARLFGRKQIQIPQR